VQSFDIRTLEEMHRAAPEIRLAFLEGKDGQFTSKISDLSFTPAIHSPDYRLVNDLLINEAHSRGVKVIPWTVNDASQMRKLLNMGVDGIITDYPEMLLNLVKGKRE
jgi:glycerophosphoryl diester phosphodiesterase